MQTNRIRRSCLRLLQVAKLEGAANHNNYHVTARSELQEMQPLDCGCIISNVRLQSMILRPGYVHVFDCTEM